jgi:hypothetical protein
LSHFFDTYAPYRQYLVSGQYSHVIADGIALLRGIKELSAQEYEKAHKGTPFYLLGVAAFLAHDYQAASFWFDAAVAEDLKNYPRRKNSPALHFMRLESKGQQYTADQIILGVTQVLDEVQKNYNARSGKRSITINVLRRIFLKRIVETSQPHHRALVTTFISFLAEWRYRSVLIDLSDAGSREPFFLHVFKGCLLFESLLKENPTKTPAHNTLGPILLEDLHAELGIPTTFSKRPANFNTLVASLVPNMPIDKTIECTLRTRNTLGHNLAWISTSLNAQTYNLLLQNVAAACVHAISKLYR